MLKLLAPLQRGYLTFKSSFNVPTALPEYRPLNIDVESIQPMHVPASFSTSAFVTQPLEKLLFAVAEGKSHFPKPSA
jgi:hypothetical protein